MNILLYDNLNPATIKGFPKVKDALANNNFRQADVRKIGNNLYRARLNKNDRLLFSLYSHSDQPYCLILEHLPNHAYEKSRFLKRGTEIDEDKIPVINSPEEITIEPITYLNSNSERFNLLDKIISFDDDQRAVYNLPAPLVVVGSAGSGKTALTLEKMKQASGDILYVSLSPFLVQNARNLYYANQYSNDEQNIDFLSFREFLESIRVPKGREITLKAFGDWFSRHKGNSKLKDPHKLFEEFRGVLTGSFTESAWLSREDYFALGVKQSIFAEDERAEVYALFEKYLAFLRQENYYDTNILSHSYLEKFGATYDFVVIDEVQDLTNIQLFLLLKSLRTAGQFILCGDSNQIVHPNFFSWSKIKSLFFKQQALTGSGELVRVLQSNYRNSPVITEVANRILKLKHARFGSIDKESNYLVNSVGEHKGGLQLLKDSKTVLQDLDSKTALSTQFAVLVMHPDQKSDARKCFNTPLVFSIQEAKGLEYTNIILYNFISGEEKPFKNIADGVDANALDKDQLNYARAKNKHDKSLEVFKFYINALYVAITRAVNNLYIVERNQKHPIIQLLNLERFSGELQVDQQKSSLDEWQKEARKLELQGKEEQAQAIRDQILQQKPVPWPVLDRQVFNELCEEVSQRKNKKKQILALEYSWLYYHRPMLNTLIKQGVKAASQPEKKSLQQIYRKHFMPYDLKNPNAVLRDTERYGVDHQTIFNLTPLMVAARLGNDGLVDALIERGANLDSYGSNGLNALQMAIEAALLDEKYARNKLPAIYEKLEPDSLSIQVQGRLIKLDKKLMGFFVLNLMFALFYRRLSEAVTRHEAFTAKTLAEVVQSLPDRILPERRKRQSYISSILSGNEVDRTSPYNRQLFKRIKRGHYIINPDIQLRVNNEWIPVHDRLQLNDLGFVPALLKLGPDKVRYYRSLRGDNFADQIDHYQEKSLLQFQHQITQLLPDELDIQATIDTDTTVCLEDA
ncbi:UvrD-helicase domain-containing protein [Microbulbifer epialgicus]|uniref:UvrD-helicase domain-containing protein n=1 Tax=Microbulbifer epialgicus TaxID=393907 RepID=A0ABV4NY35_9GAMM